MTDAREEGAYGEPWRLFDGWPPTILDETGRVILSAATDEADQICDLNMAQMHRVVADHNALANRDPKKLEAWVRAAQALEDMRPSLADITRIEPDGGRMTDYWAACDAFMGPKVKAE